MQSPKTERLSDAAWAQTEGGHAVVKVAQQMHEFEMKWLSLLPDDRHVEFTIQLADLVQAARLAGQKEIDHA